MEEREKDYITLHLDRLVHLTYCSAPLLNSLVEIHILSEGDVADLIQCRREKGSYAESTLLYRKCMGRTNGYKALIQALLDSKHTESLEILMDFYRTGDHHQPVDPQDGKLTHAPPVMVRLTVGEDE